MKDVSGWYGGDLDIRQFALKYKGIGTKYSTAFLEIINKTCLLLNNRLYGVIAEVLHISWI